MPTLDRTTIRTAIDELVTKFRSNLVASPTTTAKPFHAVHVGAPSVSDHPRPFIAINLIRARPIATVDGDRIVEVQIAARIVTDVTGTDPFGAILDHLGATDDYLDSLIGTGIIDGAEGLENRAWTFDDAKVRSGPRTLSATGKQTLIVKIERNHNQTPA